MARPRSLTAVLLTAPAALLPIVQVIAASGGYADLVNQTAPSVVTVLVEELQEGAAQRAVDRAAANSDTDALNAIIRRLLNGPERNPAQRGAEAALGSGFVIRADGLIVTNRHVIVGARKVEVKLYDGQQVPAKVVGADAATDIALLKINAGALPALRLGSAAATAVGDAVIAIGNPFGLGQTVTAGIVSARGRTLANDPYIDFIQTDAAINFGNSGGPLLATNGEVIGVTSVIFTPSGGSVGLGFAIPAETVADVASELEAHGRVDRGYLGISAQAVTPAIGRSLGVDPPAGALIDTVEPQGPAAGALLVGDVLLRLGATPVHFETLGRTAGRLHPGASVEATVMRDGKVQSVRIRIGQAPDPPADPMRTGEVDSWVPNLELGVAKSTGELRAAIKAYDETGGLIVTQLRPRGPGALAGLRIGDLITHAGSQHLQEVEDLTTVRRPSSRLPLLLRVVRDGAPAFVAVTGAEER